MSYKVPFIEVRIKTLIAKPPRVGMTGRVEFGYDANAADSGKFDNFAYIGFGISVIWRESSLFDY